MTIGPRRQARQAALRALYCWEVGKMPVEAALAAFFDAHGDDAPESLRGFTATLVEGTASDVAALDTLIAQHSAHWRIDRLAVIDRLILRMAAWELQHGAETPPAVVLNEAVELARTFGSDESPRFVNGVLDSIRRSLIGEPGAGNDEPGTANREPRTE